MFTIYAGSPPMVSQRYVFINIWRPLKDKPVTNPMELMAFRQGAMPKSTHKEAVLLDPNGLRYSSI